MENTGKVLFSDQTPQWFVALGNRWIGPIAAADVYGRIVRKEITWAHFIWRKGQKEWQRICDTADFKAAVPEQPSKSMKQEVTERSRDITREPEVGISPKPSVRQATRAKAPPPAPSEDEGAKDPDRKVWFLHHGDTQYGPFSTAEIEAHAKSGKIHGRVFIWRDGMPGWERLEKVSQFEGVIKKKAAAPTASEKRELRAQPRHPMVARILLANEDSVMVAICRDISIGGMQVLTDKIPGEVGEKIKLNVSPAKGEKAVSFRPFVAEGVIVRVLEDGRGFSFRFDRLGEAAKRSIETYIGRE